MGWSRIILEGEMTLGQLIAFRIISGYVTQPILRLTSLWQSFQEISISMERLSDIVNNPEERNIIEGYLPPLNKIIGQILYKNIYLGYKKLST